MDALDRDMWLPGLKMHVRDWGGNGHPVLLLHGLASNARIWDLTAPLIAAAGPRVVALDQRGHGQSDKPSDGYDFDSIDADVRNAVQMLRLARPVIVGHSWGASVAVNYAASHPDDAAGVVLLDGGFSDMNTNMTWEEAEARMAPPDLTRLTPDEFLDRARTWGGRLTWDGPTIGAVMGNFYVAADGRLRPHLSREHHMQILRAMFDQSPVELLRRVRCPALVAPAIDPASGREFLDRKRRAVEQALEALPNGEVRWFEDSIHDVPLQRPAELAEAVVAFTSRASPATLA